MGIEQFYFAIKKKFSEIEMNKYNFNITDVSFEQKLESSSLVCIDFNAIIHTISSEVIFKLNSELLNQLNDFSEDKIIQAKKWKESQKSINDIIIDTIITYLDDLISKMTCAKEIYIAFDGIPELNKCVEQKHRKSANFVIENMDRIIWDEFNKFKKIDGKYKIYSNLKFGFDKSNISAHTDFMKSFCDKLYIYYDDNPKIVFSGIEEYGEGEKKIIHYIHNKSNVQNGDNIFIFSPDADVILLGLLLIHHFFKKNTNIQVYVKNRDVIDINNLALNLAKLVDNNITINEQNKIMKITKDFVFLFTFFGNDFIPKIISLSNVFTNIDLLAKAYNTIENNVIIFKDNKYQIDVDKLVKLLELLVLEEQGLFDKYVKNKNRETKFRFNLSYYNCGKYICDNTYYFYFFNKSVENKYINPQELMDLIEEDKSDENMAKLKIIAFSSEYFTQYDYENIAFKYNKSAWKFITNDYNYDSTIDDTFDELFVKDYIMGLAWVVDWYYNRMFENNNKISTWFNKHTRAPFIKHILQYFKTSEIKKINLKNLNKNYVSVSNYFTKEEHKEYVKLSEQEKKHILSYLYRVRYCLSKARINYTSDNFNYTKYNLIKYGWNPEEIVINCHDVRYINKCIVPYKVKFYNAFINEMRKTNYVEKIEKYERKIKVL